MRAAAKVLACQAEAHGATLWELQDVLGAIGFYENPLRSPLAPAEWSAGTRSADTQLEPPTGQPDGTTAPRMCRCPGEKHEMAGDNVGHAANGRKFCKAGNLRRRRAERAAKRAEKTQLEQETA
jgi:hypothetical protein